MFAIPGWSISADTLKVQKEPKTSRVTTERKPDQPNGTDKKKSRKRKRGHGSDVAVEVTEENLADLWREHIEQKSSDQHGSKEKGKKGKKSKQSNEEKDDALGKIEDIQGDNFEGFSEEENLAAVGNEGARPKKKKKKEKRKDDQFAGSVQVDDHKDATEASPSILKGKGEVEDGKSKYEQRKAKASKKREERAILQANGTLPPIRPEAATSRSTEKNRTQTVKPSESSNDPDKIQKPTMTKPSKLPKATNRPEPSIAPDTTQTQAPSLPSTKLTPLQQRMAAKLTSARFRHLNQTLYTSPSDQAMRLFADSPQNYTSYHAGFRAQVAVWPQNPVEGFITDIKARSRVSVPSQKKLWREQKKGGRKPKGSDGNATADATTIHGGEKSDPLPRSRNGVCTIVDLGCGDAILAGSLSPSAKSLSLKLLSFDLATGDTPNAHLITVADISNLSAAGVKDGTVDIAICCLSLMGTNWVDVAGECARIVRGGGEVWVAEIKSRFARPGVKKKAAGGGIGRKKSTSKGKNTDGEEDEEVVALEELEDAKTKGGKDETDVSAFVEVFRKRALILKGEPDMANKMFVRMRFVKSLGARGDKGVDERHAQERNGSTWKSKIYAKTKFVDEEAEEVDESSVLKPCVYKTR